MNWLDYQKEVREDFNTKLYGDLNAAEKFAKRAFDELCEYKYSSPSKYSPDTDYEVLIINKNTTEDDRDDLIEDYTEDAVEEFVDMWDCGNYGVFRINGLAQSVACDPQFQRTDKRNEIIDRIVPTLFNYECVEYIREDMEWQLIKALDSPEKIEFIIREAALNSLYIELQDTFLATVEREFVRLIDAEKEKRNKKE